MLRGFVLGGAAIVILFADRSILAQVTIQQPVIRSFSVNTTVSVPDRGTMLLGAIKRAGETRNTAGFGPFRPGSAVGTFRDQASQSASAWIHDFDEMDRAVLDAAERTQQKPPGRQLTGTARHAFDSLVARKLPPVSVQDRLGRVGNQLSTRTMHAARDRSASIIKRDLGTGDRSTSSSRPSAVRAERCYRLGVSAEMRGKSQLARLHFQLAAKHGSTRAQQKLRQLPHLTVAR